MNFEIFSFFFGCLAGEIPFFSFVSVLNYFLTIFKTGVQIRHWYVTPSREHQRGAILHCSLVLVLNQTSLPYLGARYRNLIGDIALGYPRPWECWSESLSHLSHDLTTAFASGRSDSEVGTNSIDAVNEFWSVVFRFNRRAPLCSEMLKILTKASYKSLLP